MRKEKECPICHVKFIPKSEEQDTCDNEHCRIVADSKRARTKLYKKRMEQLGIVVDDLELIGE